MNAPLSNHMFKPCVEYDMKTLLKPSHFSGPPQTKSLSSIGIYSSRSFPKHLNTIYVQIPINILRKLLISHNKASWRFFHFHT